MMKFKRFLSITAFAAAFATVGSASAQTVPSPRDAERLYQEAHAAFLRDPARAADLYLAAYAANPMCAFLFDAGTAYDRAGNIDQAAVQFRHYLAALSGGAPDCTALPAVRQSTEQALQRLDRAIAERQARLAPPQVPVPPAGPRSDPPGHVGPATPFVHQRLFRVEPGPIWPSVTAWSVGGLALAWGVYSLAGELPHASSMAASANVDPLERSRWNNAAESARLWGAVSLGVGIAAIAGGIVWWQLRPTRRVLVTFAPTFAQPGLAAAVRF